MTDCKGVTTPGSRDDNAKAAQGNEAEKAQKEGQVRRPVAVFDGAEELEPGDPAVELPAAEATKYRAVSARLNYMCRDRVYIAYACKGAARRMSKPQQGDWMLLKRIARYLRAHPRLCQRFPWQDLPEKIDAYVDSDWAGCKRTGRSTSGGALMLGQHCIK